MAFTDLDTVKAALGIPVTSTKLDAALAGALAASEAAVLACLGLTASVPTTYVVVADAGSHHHHHGDGGVNCFETGPRPVLSITEVKDRDTVLDATEYKLVGGPGGWLIKRYHGHWHGEVQSGTFPIQATIVAGFTVGDPTWADLAWGVAEYAALIHTVKPGIAEERIGRYQVKFTDPTSVGLPPFPPVLAAAIDRYNDPFGGYVPIALPE